jgi:hypothetical protein
MLVAFFQHGLEAVGHPHRHFAYELVKRSL